MRLTNTNRFDVVAVLLAVVLTAALAGCDRPVDVTAKPGELIDTATAESAPAAIYVSAPVDITKTEGEIVRLLPTDIAQIARRLPKAACQTTNGKQVCLDVRLWGRISRGGEAKISGTVQGLELQIPIRYELTAQPVGAGSATPISGSLSVTASFALTMDERWQPALKLGQGYTWPQGAKIKVLGGETSLQADVEPLLTQRLQRVTPAMVAGLVPPDLRQRVEMVWRYLHYPVALSQDRQIWLRGTPVGLRFGGLASNAAGTELRMAIAARLQTFVGDRPAPLPPSPLIQLGSGMEPAGGGIVLPAEVSYEALIASTATKLPTVPAPPVTTGSAPAAIPSVSSVSFFPSGKRLAVGVHLVLPANGNWLQGHAVAYYLASPAMKPGSPSIVLSRCEPFGPSGKQNARQKELPFLIDGRFVEGLEAAVDVNAGDKLAAAIELLQRQQSLPLAKGLKVWLTPASAKVVRIVPGTDSLRLQIEVVGDFSVRHDGTDVASDTDAVKVTP